MVGCLASAAAIAAFGLAQALGDAVMSEATAPSPEFDGAKHQGDMWDLISRKMGGLAPPPSQVKRLGATVVGSFLVVLGMVINGVRDRKRSKAVVPPKRTCPTGAGGSLGGTTSDVVTGGGVGTPAVPGSSASTGGTSSDVVIGGVAEIPAVPASSAFTGGTTSDVVTGGGAGAPAVPGSSASTGGTASRKKKKKGGGVGTPAVPGSSASAGGSSSDVVIGGGAGTPAVPGSSALTGGTTSDAVTGGTTSDVVTGGGAGTPAVPGSSASTVAPAITDSQAAVSRSPELRPEGGDAATGCGSAELQGKLQELGRGRLTFGTTGTPTATSTSGAKDRGAVHDLGSSTGTRKVSAPRPWSSATSAVGRPIGGDLSEVAKAERQVKSILNKLTRDKFNKLYAQFLACVAGTESREAIIGVVAREIFAKATMQHSFVEMYADFCLKLSDDLNSYGTQVNFRHVLLDQCQRSFNTHLDPPRIDADLDYEEQYVELVKYKTKMVGNARLIGQLLRRRMLSSTIIFHCADQLVRIGSPEALETLSAFLETIGATFDAPRWQGYARLDAHFVRAKALSEDVKQCPRIRCLLKDLLEKRNNQWRERKPNAPVPVLAGSRSPACGASNTPPK